MSIPARKARMGERVIINALFACAVLSIAVTVGEADKGSLLTITLRAFCSKTDESDCKVA